MKSTQKLGFIAVGGMIVIASVLGGCSRTIDSAKTITCERLNIVDDKGKTVISLGVAEDKDEGEIVVFNRAG